MMYRENPMEIWAQDLNGNYHHFTSNDSVQYLSLTQQFGSQLENAFMGHCNSHNKVEIVNISPVLIMVINAPNQNDLEKSIKSDSSKHLELINPEEIMNPIGVKYQTDPSIKAEQKGDKKH
ncbi:MAG: hypothetical protein U9N31_00595 [Candidatus Marinimicrobia bacterium]|nr:hypothetical protein [Candidatus Neomarinimicrobiota bacterium]